MQMSVLIILVPIRIRKMMVRGFITATGNDEEFFTINSYGGRLSFIDILLITKMPKIKRAVHQHIRRRL